MAKKTAVVSTRMPVPMRTLARRAADRQEMSLSRFIYRAVADAVAEEFEVTTGDGLQAAQELEAD